MLTDPRDPLNDWDGCDIVVSNHLIGKKHAVRVDKDGSCKIFVSPAMYSLLSNEHGTSLTKLMRAITLVRDQVDGD